MPNPTRWLLLVAGVGAATPAPAAERPWIEVRSPGFTVLSDAGDKEAREAAWQFEQVRAALPKVWPWARRDEAREFVVFVARDADALRALAPKWFGRDDDRNVTGVFVSGVEADYVALRSDRVEDVNPRVNPYRTAFEGYADNVLVRHFDTVLPPWFRSGLREMLGNTLIRARDVDVGRAIPWHIERLTGRATQSVEGQRAEDRRTTAPGTAAVLPLARLIAVTRDDPEFRNEADRWSFDAQSWAFVHFLMYGDGGAHRAKFNRLAALLREGTAADAAVRESLGDVAALERGFRDHVRLRALPFQRFAVDVDVVKEKWPSRPVTAAEALSSRARFAVAMGEPDAARERIASARAADPGHPGSYEAEGLLLFREKKGPEARAALARARELGSKSTWIAQWLDRRPAAAPAAPTARAGKPAASAPAAAANVGQLIGACNKGDDQACRQVAASLLVACEQGDAPSCMPLGWLYVNGRGVDLDVFRGESYYGRACDAGEPKACAALARSILDRTEEPDERARAHRLLARACEGGVTSACPSPGKD
jgi:hypothetical protein